VVCGIVDAASSSASYTRYTQATITAATSTAHHQHQARHSQYQVEQRTLTTLLLLHSTYIQRVVLVQAASASMQPVYARIIIQTRKGSGEAQTDYILETMSIIHCYAQHYTFLISLPCLHTFRASNRHTRLP
jgi:hypothetical protein